MNTFLYYQEWYPYKRPPPPDPTIVIQISEALHYWYMTYPSLFYASLKGWPLFK